MILDPGTVIDLEPLKRALRASLIEWKYIDAPPGATLFDSQFDDAREAGAHDFVRHVYDNSESELPIRNALAYVLNLDDDAFPAVADRLEPPFIGPYHPHIRRFLETLWDRTWSPWKIELFDPDDYELR